MPGAQVHVPPARRVEDDVGRILGRHLRRERSVPAAELERPDERPEEPMRAAGKGAPLRRPVEHLVGDGEQVEVAVDDLE